MRLALAILWAQCRTVRNRLPRWNGGTAFAAFAGVLWYGGFTVMAVFAARYFAEAPETGSMQRVLAPGLLAVFVYWQSAPVLMAAAGASLDLKKLLVYPVPRGWLFGLEVTLRVSMCAEMLILLVGTGIGLERNPGVPGYKPLWLVPFALLNLLLSVGVRDLITAMWKRRGAREIAALSLVLVVALPQLLLLKGLPAWLHPALAALHRGPWPWNAAAALLVGNPAWMIASELCAWLAVAYAFGRWQFERGLTLDPGAAEAEGRRPGRRGWVERMATAAAAPFHDPLAAMVEKEVLSMGRSRRFRLLATIGFFLGLVIWVPLAFSGDPSTAFMRDHYLTIVSLYSVVLLADAIFWNVFGFDGAAAQFYFVTPASIRTALAGKNVAAIFFLLLEITAVVCACALLRLPVTPARLGEAYGTALTLSLFLLAAGNLTSVWQPRRVEAGSVFRKSAGGAVQAAVLMILPLACAPLALAYLARYAFDSEAAFYAVLAVDAAAGWAVYKVASDSAAERAAREKETMAARLSRGAGLVGD